jgi:hypothetical protein
MNYVGDLWQFNLADNVMVLVLDQKMIDEIEYVIIQSITFLGKGDRSGIASMTIEQLTAYYTKVS